MRNRISVSVLLFALGCADVDTTSVPPLQSSRNASDDYELIDVGSFGAYSHGFFIDDHGALYGRYGVSNTAGRSFRWTEKAGLEDLGDFNGRPFLVLNANKHGVLAGHIPPATTPGPSRSVVYLPHRGFQLIDDNDHGGQAWDVNKYGVVAGTRFPATFGSSQAYRWTEKDGLQVLPVTIPPSVGPVNVNVGAIRDDGLIAGTIRYRPIGQPCCRMVVYFWDEIRGTQHLPQFSAGQIGVTGVNDNDVAVGGAHTRAPFPGETVTTPLTFFPGTIPAHAWRWSPARGYEDLGTLGGTNSVSWGVDEEGNAYGWAQDAAGLQHAVKWTWAGEIVRLPSLGGFSQADPPNKHGVLVGQAATATGEQHVVVWVPKKD